MTELVPTQADREAAWPFAPECIRLDPNTGAERRGLSGVYDKSRILQAFAAHRISSANEAIEEAIKQLDARLAELTGHRRSDDDLRYEVIRAREIVRALKSGSASHGG